jgi:hypothetical protein
MNVGKMVDFILCAVALAMGVAVVVLSILKALDANTGIILLGIGMSCIGMSLLDTETPVRAVRKKRK